MATSPIYSWPEPDNTDLVKNGALAIRTLGNAIDTTMGTMVAKTVVDAKGDLIAGTANDTVNRLAVGNNGETLVADSSTSTGLRYQGNFSAGKNAILNGDFRIWQRGTSITPASGYGYGPDRFATYSYAASASTISQQAFTPGTAPVAGYEAQYFARVNSTNTSAIYEYRVEDVRTYVGQTTTLSFWAKSATAQTITNGFYQNFGSGGSAQVTVISPISTAITTSWARYSVTVTMPSISGKTVGTSSFVILNWVGAINNNFDLWGVQWEVGNTATAFQTATGTIQGELAACQRYFIRIGGNKIYEVMGLGYTDSTTETYASRTLPVTMRTTPSTTFAAANLFRTNQGGGSVATGTGIGQDGNASSPNLVNFYLQYSATGAASRGAAIQANNSTSATMDISAEL